MSSNFDCLSSIFINYCQPNKISEMASLFSFFQYQLLKDPKLLTDLLIALPNGVTCVCEKHINIYILGQNPSIHMRIQRIY